MDESLPPADRSGEREKTPCKRLLTWDEYGSIPKVHMFTMMAKEYGLSDQQVERLCKDWYDTFGDYTVKFPQARGVVEQLKKKYKVGL